METINKRCITCTNIVLVEDNFCSKCGKQEFDPLETADLTEVESESVDDSESENSSEEDEGETQDDSPQGESAEGDGETQDDSPQEESAEGGETQDDLTQGESAEGDGETQDDSPQGESAEGETLDDSPQGESAEGDGETQDDSPQGESAEGETLDDSPQGESAEGDGETQDDSPQGESAEGGETQDDLTQGESAEGDGETQDDSPQGESAEGETLDDSPQGESAEGEGETQDDSPQGESAEGETLDDSPQGESAEGDGETQDDSPQEESAEGNQSKKKTQENNPSKPEKENVAKQVTDTPADTPEDTQVSAQARSQSDGSSVDQQASQLKHDSTQNETVFGTGKASEDVPMDGGKSDKNQKKSEKKKNKKRKSSAPKKVTEREPSQCSQTSETRMTTRSMNNEVEVMFHVLIPRDSYYDPSKEDIYICLGPGKHHSLKNMWKMNNITRPNGYYSEYSLPVKMTRQKRNEHFRYKYLFMRKDKQAMQDECVYFMQELIGNENPDREFNFPLEKTSSEIWHQYDGFIYYPESSSILVNRVIQFFKQMRERAKSDVRQVAEYFFPSADEIIQSLKTKDGSVHAEEFLHTIFSVMHSLRNQMLFLRDGRFYVDSTVLADCFESIMVTLFDELLTSVKNVEKDGVSDHALSVAVFMLVMVKENNTGMSKYYRQMETFFKALLLKADHEKMSLPNYVLMKSHFPRRMTLILTSLEETIKDVAMNVQNDSSWMYSLPLLHFLNGDSEPFKLSESCQHLKAKWWGIRELGLEVVKEDMKNQTEGYYCYNNDACSRTQSTYPKDWSIPVETIIKDLHPLFEVDYLLPRSIMAAVTMRQLQSAISPARIPPYVVAACLFYHCQSFDTKQMDEHSQNLLSKLFVVNAEQFKNRNETELSSATSERILVELNISKNIVKNLVENNIEKQISVLPSIMEVCLAVVSGLYAVHQLQNETKDSESAEKNDACELLQNLVAHVVCWLRHYQQFQYKNTHLRVFHVWNNMINIQIAPSELQRQWQESLLQAFEHEISSLGIQTCDEVLMAGTDCEFLSTSLKEHLTSAAFSSFETKMMENPDKMLPLTEEFGKMMSKLLEKQWPKTETDHEVLHFVCTFKPLTQYFERFYGKTKRDGNEYLLNETCIALLAKASSVLSIIRDTICNGIICVGNLRKVLLERENLLTLVSAAEANFSDSSAKKTDVAHLKKVLEVREKELNACDQYLNNADSLMSFCIDLKEVDTGQISKDVRTTCQTMDQMNLEQFLEIAIFESENRFDVTNYHPSVNIFSIPDELLLIIPELQKLMNSELFHAMWCLEGASENLESSLNSILTVWKLAKQKWDALSKDIRNGTITFLDIKKHISRFDADYEKIKQEFNLMNEDKTWVDERIQQLKTYSLVDRCLVAAVEIIQIMEVFNFTGDFDPIQKILNLKSTKSFAMHNMNQSVLETCNLLKDVTSEQIESLVAFRKSKSLVDWLRQSMKDGLKELKVFVDLAYISAGEGDYEIQRVNYLHAATTAYAPLVFDCNQQDVDYSQFLKSCESVWREMERKPNLPKMLRDTGNFLEWLKDVSQSHGSVEVTSLSQAAMINSRGVYRIGNLTDEKAPSQLDLNHIICLSVRDSNSDEKCRKYSHDQLVDLQSRLMLVAGRAEKGKENVDRFMMILDGIVRLSKTYIKLISDGCVLFNCWNAEFRCDTAEYTCVILNFGESSELLLGRRQQHQLDEFINSLANLFEKCHLDWLKYLSDKRDNYLELNFFTIGQLVFLQKELIKIGTEAEPSNLIFPLLSLIKPDCTMTDLQNAMQKAKDEIFKNKETNVMEDDQEDTTKENEDQEDTTKENDFFIEEVMEAGFTKILAKAALMHVGATNIDNGIMWCVEHDEDDEFQDSAVDSAEMAVDSYEEQFSGWTSETSSFISIAASVIRDLPEHNIKDSSVEALTRNIDNIWQTFLKLVSSSVADYLSVEHLGIILHMLALSCDQTLDRKLPVQFKARIPNLVVCQNSDVLNAVLHIYMEDPDQPLPQPDEVLLCTPETSFDEVDIFLRRAYFSSFGKIHCLVYVDLLRYEIEEKIEKKVFEYTAKANDSDYKLVVLCSSENEYRARIVSALERHRCQPPIIKIKRIKDYLTRKFTIIKENKNKKSASYVDFAQSTVRVVKSKRSGVGKTLYKNRRVAELCELNSESDTGDLSVSIPLYEKNVVIPQVADKLLPWTLKPEQVFPRIFHLNISYEVQEGLNYLLFNLLILGKLTNERGNIWLRSPMDLYLVEIIPLSDIRNQSRTNVALIHPIFEVLPHVTCWSPKDSLQILTKSSIPADYDHHDLRFDQEEFRSVVYQRPFQYLSRWESRTSLSDIEPSRPEGTQVQCLETLLRHCGVQDPSWAELHHFVWFLNTQLVDFERSTFCSSSIQDDLPGFSQFVLRFLIQMSRDFATRSLNMSEETPIGDTKPMEPEDDVISQDSITLASESWHDLESDDSDEDVILPFPVRRTSESNFDSELMEQRPMRLIDDEEIELGERQIGQTELEENYISQFQMRRTWDMSEETPIGDTKPMEPEDDVISQDLITLASESWHDLESDDSDEDVILPFPVRRTSESNFDSELMEQRPMRLIDDEEIELGERQIGQTELEENYISQFQMRRTWESSPHPYIFFNPDGQSMTFLGFNINRHTGDLIDQQTDEVLEKAIMPRNLQESLVRNRVPLNENFDNLERLKRLEKLCNVMAGIDYIHDPDVTYELTTDNVKKILAIYMRFRCNIPVLIMGETGCGKTRLIKFMCSLQCLPGTEVENMVIMKVHGGTTADDIIKKVHEAEHLAEANAQINKHMYTVLFFDEANTTEAIGLIKEIMCDGTMDGHPLQLSDKLKIVAACNPYRKHSDHFIERLEKAGLGYHVDAEKTTDRLGRVPMRRLVYRVQPLPQSMLPLVWDFGQLNTTVEELYIRQMVNHYLRDLRFMNKHVEVIISILIESQNFMRHQEDECSFVSLRDVERVLKVMTWFYQQSQKNRTLFDMMDEEDEEEEDEDNDDEDSDEEETEENSKWPDDFTMSLILALGVCYRASLRSREEYDEFITDFFQIPCSLPGGVTQFVKVITRCQDVFLEHVQLEENIAKNQALKENLFMMIICIELRIPLFLVGKPGSSKSLAKTIVSDAMQGNSARNKLFKELKEAQMVSFQCSPLSVAEGILGTFRQCARFQKDKDLDRFVSIVVLDEVGLAEDSARMPLKTLHPLLEDGCQGDEKPEDYKKVAFIGISNWALDPAKMNRGILVQREVPDNEELVESAEGICARNPTVLAKIKPFLPKLAEAYKAVFNETLNKREFFGLRDFYSLVKMIYGFATKQHRHLCWHQMEHAILRNFGGLEKESVNPVKIFSEITGFPKREKPHENDPVNTTAGLIESALVGDRTGRSHDRVQTQSATESRYLLLLTENYGALRILQQMLDKHSVTTIFGSSFPKDQEYTQVCRNINRIKVCMETGNTVILLNLENLYESLYDALNQYYAHLGGERFVDLGLGTHRVKCRVHRDFRLIVVAEKQIVYEKFPIPLINRLEKHFLTLSNIMSEEQSFFAGELDRWANQFVQPYRTVFNTEQSVSVAEAFMGYHPDTTAAIVLQIWEEKHEYDDNFLEDCKQRLLWCATPESVLRIKDTQLFNEYDKVYNIYFTQQYHDDIFMYMKYKLEISKDNGLFVQVTTHSKLLTDQEKEEIMTSHGLEKNNIILLTLQSFDTEQQFCQKIRNFVKNSGNGLKLLLIQSGSGDKNMSLIKSAQYCVEDELLHEDRQFAVFFIVQLSKVAGGCFTGFMAGKWHSLHIDELRPEGNLPSVHQLHNKTPANVLQGQTPQGMPNRVANPVTQHGIAPQHEEMELTENQGDEDASEVTPMDTEQESHLEQSSYFQEMILRCIPSAASLVNDDAQDSSRSTERIEILLDFLEDQTPKSPDMSFLIGISNIIIRLLQEKEQYISGPTAVSWLSKEAANPANVKKAGTFRRSWLQCLENKIVPILAGVVAFLDVNCNLDIIRDTSSGYWAHILWLRILHSPSACELHYQDLLSPETHQELGEIVPYSTGVHGMPFSAVLPFSWLLHQLIETGLNNANHTYHEDSGYDNEKHPLLMFVSNVILKTPIGKILNELCEEMGGNKEAIITAYIKDFIHTKYQCSTPDEHQILCGGLEVASRQANMDIAELDLMSALVAIHHTYSLVKGRLQAFLDIEQVWPQLLDAVCMMREKEAHILLSTQELTLDVLALVLLLEQLEPQKEQLNSKNGIEDWLEKVKTFSPQIQRIIDYTDNMALGFGPVCLRHMEEARCLWTRVMTMKLFLECFSPKESKKKEKLPDSMVKRCMPLWGLLGQQANLKKIKSLQAVENFLKSVGKGFLQKALQKRGKCTICSSPFEAPPVLLPCKEKLCQKCFYNLLPLGKKNCPKCHRIISDEFVRNPVFEQKDLSADYQSYQRCCNTFLMAVVSNLCFGGDTAPEDEVIERILSYITRTTPSQGPDGTERLQTKQMTVFDDLVDPTPVVRSFLLQLLIHKSGGHVEQHLNEFFKHAGRLCDQQTEHSSGILQFSLMVIQCLEDQLHESAAVGDFENEVKMAFQSLTHASEYITCSDVDMNKMKTIANARFGLITLAKYLQMLVIEESITRSPIFNKMIRKAKDLIEIENFDWPKNFFLKQLCREFGTESYHRICQWDEIQWVAIEEQTDKVRECADQYMMCSFDYQKIRDMVAKTLLGEDSAHLDQMLKEIRNPLKKMYLLLAIHREVTLKYVQPNVHDETMVKAVENLKTFAEKTKCITDRGPLHRGLLKQLLENNFGQQTSQLNLQQDSGLRDQSIQCMLFHFYLVLRSCEKQKDFLHPLIAMATNPALFMKSLLPTMPQDDLSEIIKILKEKLGSGEKVVIYRCPSGHRYAITECGRPYTEGRCNACGLKIGGLNHKPFTGNTEDSGIDETKPGHILGDPSQRPDYSVSERKLTGQACALLRLLTHAALLLGCDINYEAVSSMIQPPVEDASLFFWNHIQKDIEQLQRGVGKSVDDIFLIVHFIFHQMSDEKPRIARSTSPKTLLTKEEREDWEEQFATTFIVPVLQDLDNLLQTLNDRIMKDTRFGQDKLLNILYEVDTTHDTKSVVNLHNVPDVWRYRSRITLNHFLQEFQLQNTKTDESHLVLRLFHSESYYLQAMRYIPSILTLQRHLMLRFQRRLNRAEAHKMTVKDVLKTENHVFDIQKLFDDFVAAWECVKEKLLDYGCLSVHGDIVRIPDEFRNVKITSNSKLAILFPSTTGPGLCSYILLEFLLQKQNQFMDSYCRIIKQRYDSLPEVPVKDLKANHLICYHPDKDLLPLVLANCNYSFKLGEGTKVEYDFDGFENQLEEMVLQAKSRVQQQNGVIPLDTMLYHADTTNAIVFKTLREKVRQEELSSAVRLQISAELHTNLPDICDSIDKLDIAVCFLKSLVDDGSQSLQEFMTDVLKMKQTIKSQKARQVCKFKHVQSLWLVLNLEKSQVLAANHQDAFDNLGSDMKEKLSENQVNELMEFCQHQTLNKLEFLMQKMFDCVLLRISQPRDQFDESAIDLKEMSLQVIIEGDIDSPLYAVDPVNMEGSTTGFPDTIKGNQATSAWLTVYTQIEEKRRQAL